MGGLCLTHRPRRLILRALRVHLFRTQGSKYWYSTVAMHSTRDPPPGWVKNGDEWEFDPAYDGPLYPADATRAPAHLSMAGNARTGAEDKDEV